MLTCPLYLRMLLRDWRRGELTLLALALVIAVTCISALNNFTFAIENLLNQQTTALLGADVAISSNSPIPKTWQTTANALQLTQATATSFLSMASANDKLQLVQVKAVSTPYPLRGTVKISRGLTAQIRSVNEAPSPGQLWVDAKLLPLLAINVGDTIAIGAATFTVSALLTEEPGQTGDWFNISPHLIMNQADLAKTGVIQTGSKVTYTWLIAGTNEQLNRLKLVIMPGLSDQQKWQDQTTNPAITNVIKRTLSYLNLGSLISLLLAGIAISMAIHRYSQRQQTTIAILRCFGVTARSIYILYLGNLFILGTVASLIGIVFGYTLQPVLAIWLKGLVPHFHNEFSFKPALVSYLAGLLTLLSFTFFQLLNLRQISAISLFKQVDLQSHAIVNYLVAFFLLFIVAFITIHSWQLIVVTVVGLLSYLVLALILLLMSGLVIDALKNKLSFTWRFGFTTINRNIMNSMLQLCGVGLALSAFLILAIFKSNLIDNWQQQLPNKAPNYFVINIQSEQVAAFKRFINHNQIESAAFYPIVRGRLISINDVPVATKLGDRSKDINALQRELNLSWTDTLPADNQLITGNWQPKQTAWLSIEQELAQQLGVKIGDKLEFAIGEQRIDVPITSIRRVDWTNFKPNFFILFNQHLLANLPKSYLTSFYLPENQQTQLLRLVKAFPNITIIDVASSIKKIQSILQNVSYAITFITLFCLLIGIIITILAMLAVNDIKQKETSILKLLGVQQKQLFLINCSGSVIISLYASGLAAALAISLNYYLTRYIFHLTLYIPWSIIFSAQFLIVIFILLTNYFILKIQPKPL